MKAPIHGGRVFEAARALNRPWSGIIDFSANINPLGQPEGLKEALFADFDRSLHYPEVRAESLIERLAGQTGLTPDHLLPGAGSTPHFHLLARCLELTRPVIVGPAFAEYEGALTRAGLPSQYVLTREEDDWLVTPETLTRLWDARPDGIFVAQPANPTGRLVPGALLLELAAECRDRDIWLLVDEAFIDFTENARSVLPLVAENRRLIVFRSLTKIYALPGLRLAYLAAHAQTAARLARQMEPWPLSSPALSAGHYCLSRPGFKEATRKAVRVFRERQIRELAALDLGRLFPAEANYLLIKLRDDLDPPALLEHLFQDGILVRDAANFHGLKAGFLRLAVRPEPEVEALVSSLKTFLELPAHARTA